MGIDYGQCDTVGSRLEQEVEELRDALVKLPLRYRQPLVMQVLGGFTTAEIAQTLGLSLTATLTRLHRARHRLRELCDPDTPRRQA